MIEGTLRRMRECSQHNRLNIEVNLFTDVRVIVLGQYHWR
jgi:hypothetical protein